MSGSGGGGRMCGPRRQKRRAATADSTMQTLVPNLDLRCPDGLDCTHAKIAPGVCVANALQVLSEGGEREAIALATALQMQPANYAAAVRMLSTTVTLALGLHIK